MLDKVQLKNGKVAHIVEVYEQGVAYETDICEGDEEFVTDTIMHSDILYVFNDGEIANRTQLVAM